MSYGGNYFGLYFGGYLGSLGEGAPPAPTSEVSGENWREYIVFFRGPVGAYAFHIASRDAVRNGNKYLGLLTAIPEPADNPLNDFGIQGGGGFVLEIADYDGDWPEVGGGGDPGNALLLEDGTLLLLEDGTAILLES